MESICFFSRYLCLHKPVGVRLFCIQGCVLVSVPAALPTCCLQQRTHAHCPAMKITGIQSSGHGNLGGRQAKLLSVIQNVNIYVRFFYTKKNTLIYPNPWECFESHIAFEVQHRYFLSATSILTWMNAGGLKLCLTLFLLTLRLRWDTWPRQCDERPAAIAIRADGISGGL